MRLMNPQPVKRSYGGVSGPERDARRREKLLDAALDLFSGQGYRATTVADICKAAHLSTRQFYYYFDDREAVLQELYQRANDAARAAVLSAMATTTGAFVERLRVALHAYTEAMTADLRITRLSSVAVVGVSAEFEERRTAERDRWIFALNTLAAASVAAGEIPDRDYTLAWSALLGAVSAMGALAARRTDPPSVADMAAEIDRVLVGLFA